MPDAMFRPSGLGVVGEGVHRSGWPYAMQALAPLMSPGAPVLLDDFVERTFLFDAFRRQGIVHRSPWIGICHHPLKPPAGFGLGLKDLARSPAWQASLPQLKLVVVLVKHLAPKLRRMWGVPCLVLRHPSGTPGLTWSPQAFQRNPRKQLIQVGAYLRNTQAIRQVAVPPWLHKVRLNQPAFWIPLFDARCRELFADRPERGTVSELAHLDPGAYDRLLSENLVFLELIDASANNTIVECIARNTPVVVNRLPGPEFYLGPDYPLFYDRIGEVEALLTPGRIAAAHAYLKQLPKAWLSGQVFADALARGCRAALPDLWPSP